MSRKDSILLCAAMVLVVAGCREPSTRPGGPAAGPEAVQPDDKASQSGESGKPVAPTTEPSAPEPTGATTRTVPDKQRRVVVVITSPTDPQRGWLTIEQVVKPGQPAKATGIVAGPRKLVITTENVKRIRIDLPKAGVPSDRRVVLRIDEQGIEITGRRGPIGRFDRSRLGAWSATRKKP